MSKKKEICRKFEGENISVEKLRCALMRLATYQLALSSLFSSEGIPFTSIELCNIQQKKTGGQVHGNEKNQNWIMGNYNFFRGQESIAEDQYDQHLRYLAEKRAEYENEKYERAAEESSSIPSKRMRSAKNKYKRAEREYDRAYKLSNPFNEKLTDPELKDIYKRKDALLSENESIRDKMEKIRETWFTEDERADKDKFEYLEKILPEDQKMKLREDKKEYAGLESQLYEAIRKDVKISNELLSPMYKYRDQPERDFDKENEKYQAQVEKILETPVPSPPFFVNVKASHVAMVAAFGILLAGFYFYGPRLWRPFLSQGNKIQAREDEAFLKIEASQISLVFPTIAKIRNTNKLCKFMVKHFPNGNCLLLVNANGGVRGWKEIHKAVVYYGTAAIA